MENKLKEIATSRKSGFTLIEILVTLAIFAIILGLGMQWLINGPIKASNLTSRIADQQSGVNTTLDMITSTLQKSSQIHLIGKEIYEDTMDLRGLDKDKLDKDFSYIAFKKVGDQRILFNIVPSLDTHGNLVEWQEVPILATQKEDAFNTNYINYTMDIYKNDSKMKEKMDKKILSISITGQTYAKGGGKVGDPYTSTKDITLNNANQILISKWLKDGVENVTAIAYDNNPIKKKKTSTRAKANLGITVAVDMSNSMRYLLGNDTSTKLPKPSDAQINDTRRAIVGRTLREDLLRKIHEIAKNNNIDVSLYMFGFSFANQVHAFTDFQATNPFSSGLPRYGDNRDPLFNVLRSSNWDNVGNNLPGKAQIIFNPSEPYLHSLAKITNLERPGTNRKYAFGPYKLQYREDADLGTTKGRSYVDADQMVSDTNIGLALVGEKFREPLPLHGSGTNIGEALWLSVDILNQMRDYKSISSINNLNIFDGEIENRYLILLTDGNPEGYMRLENINQLGNHNKSHMLLKKPSGLGPQDMLGRYRTSDRTGSLEFIESVAKNNIKNDTFTKAYLIGFSGMRKDLESQDKIIEYINKYGGKDANGNYKAVKKDAKSEVELQNVFKEITENIEITMKLFEGPKKLR